MEKIIWTDVVKNGVLRRVDEELNILLTVQRRKANWIGHMLRGNWLLKHVTEEKVEGIRTRRRRHKQLLDALKETRRYWKLKEEALDRAEWGTRFGRGCCKTDNMMMVMWLATVVFVGTESWVQNPAGEVAYRRPIKSR
jgi:hypothetical protein